MQIIPFVVTVGFTHGINYEAGERYPDHDLTAEEVDEYESLGRLKKEQAFIQPLDMFIVNEV